MEGLKSLAERDLNHYSFSCSEYKNRIFLRAKAYIEKYFYRDFINIFNDLKSLADSGREPFKNYSLKVPEELEITFASEMMISFLKSLGYGVNIDISCKEETGAVTLNILLNS